MVARVRVKLLPGGHVFEVDAGTVRGLLEKLGANPETHVVLRDGRPLLAEDRLEDGWELVVVRVLSGG